MDQIEITLLAGILNLIVALLIILNIALVVILVMIARIGHHQGQPNHDAELIETDADHRT